MRCCHWVVLVMMVMACRTNDDSYHPPEYRLADMVLSKRERAYPNGEELHLREYPRSLASDYLRATGDEGNLEVLQQLISRRQFPKPDATTLVVHVRVGDVVDRAPASVEDMLYVENASVPRKYVKTLDYYTRALEKVPDTIESVVVIGGFHKDIADRTKSRAYFSQVASHIGSLVGGNVPVEERLRPAPNWEWADEDFIFMASAKHFLPSGGGFSSLIARYSQNIGGAEIYGG